MPSYEKIAGITPATTRVLRADLQTLARTLAESGEHAVLAGSLIDTAMLDLAPAPGGHVLVITDNEQRADRLRQILGNLRILGTTPVITSVLGSHPANAFRNAIDIAFRTASPTPRLSNNRTLVNSGISGLTISLARMVDLRENAHLQRRKGVSDVQRVARLRQEYQHCATVLNTMTRDQITADLQRLDKRAAHIVSGLINEQFSGRYGALNARIAHRRDAQAMREVNRAREVAHVVQATVTRLHPLTELERMVSPRSFDRWLNRPVTPRADGQGITRGR